MDDIKREPEFTVRAKRGVRFSSIILVILILVLAFVVGMILFHLGEKSLPV